MSKDKKEVEKIGEEQADNVSGGFIGRDWSNTHQAIYSRWGIEHRQHGLKKDEYYFCGQKIPKKFVYKMVDEYLNAPYKRGMDWNDEDKFIQKELSGLRKQIEEGNLDTINKLWEDFS